MIGFSERGEVVWEMEEGDFEDLLFMIFLRVFLLGDDVDVQIS